MKTRALALMAVLLAVAAVFAHAGKRSALRSPTPGVLCDRFVCADDGGISTSLTARYLGKNAATRLRAQGDFDRTEFTFANGVFCDVKERLCREDRFYGPGGKRSATISTTFTELLFGSRASARRPDR